MDKKTAICCICGKAFPVWDMECLNYGKGKKYFCFDCIQEGQKRVDDRVIGNFQKKKAKEKK